MGLSLLAVPCFLLLMVCGGVQSEEVEVKMVHRGIFLPDRNGDPRKRFPSDVYNTLTTFLIRVCYPSPQTYTPQGPIPNEEIRIKVDLHDDVNATFDNLEDFQLRMEISVNHARDTVTMSIYSSFGSYGSITKQEHYPTNYTATVNMNTGIGCDTWRIDLLEEHYHIFVLFNGAYTALWTRDVRVIAAKEIYIPTLRTVWVTGKKKELRDLRADTRQPKGSIVNYANASQVVQNMSKILYDSSSVHGKRRTWEEALTAEIVRSINDTREEALIEQICISSFPVGERIFLSVFLMSKETSLRYGIARRVFEKMPPILGFFARKDGSVSLGLTIRHQGSHSSLVLFKKRAGRRDIPLNLDNGDENVICTWRQSAADLHHVELVRHSRNLMHMFVFYQTDQSSEFENPMKPRRCSLWISDPSDLDGRLKIIGLNQAFAWQIQHNITSSGDDCPTGVDLPKKSGERFFGYFDD